MQVPAENGTCAERLLSVEFCERYVAYATISHKQIPFFVNSNPTFYYILILSLLEWQIV